MPYYDFTCTCGKKLTVWRPKMADGAPSWKKCPKCENRMNRVYDVPQIRFIGSWPGEDIKRGE